MLSDPWLKFADTQGWRKRGQGAVAPSSGSVSPSPVGKKFHVCLGIFEVKLKKLFRGISNEFVM